LPSLGRIDPPLNAQPIPSPDAPDKPLLAERALAEMPLGDNAAAGMPPPKSPAELALERELSGPVFGPQGAASAFAMAAGDALPGSAPGDGGPADGPTRRAAPGDGLSGRGVPGTELSTLLKSSVTAAAHAQMLPARRLLLPKGAFLDCTLETAIDSTLPGMTTCVTATDTFGVDGKVVLLERGTKLIGETRGQVQQGAARIFVLWTEARTPADVVVPLDSPGADELGRSGLAGEVERHFWQRFGAAMLVSVIDGAVETAVQSARGSSGTVVVNPSASQDVLTEILKNTVNIAPTVVKRNGDRIQVLVARDVDFRSVYELRSATGR
jgi:type IV secretion system protein VirB10